MFTALEERLAEAYSEILTVTSQKIVEIFPQFLLTLVVLIVGIILAYIARKFVLKLSDFFGLDKIAAKVNVDRALHKIGIKKSISRILGMLVYWLIILFAVFLLAETLEWNAASEAVGAIVAYIPHLIFGLILFVVGLVVGRFFRDVVSTSLARAGVTASVMLGLLVQVLIVLFACLLALREIGFDTSVITTNIAIIIAVVLASVGFAVALGLRPFLENYFLCRHLRSIIHIGDVIQINEKEGEVFSISPTSVIIKAGDDEIIFPARTFFEESFTKKPNISNQ